jgi:dolichyl-diphosphooligosaccharide--protein glycosyltransferase
MRAVRRGVRAGWPVLFALLAACQGGLIGTPPAECPTGVPAPDPQEAATAVTVETDRGPFTVALRPDAAPLAVANFLALARCGFYEGVTFHRVLSGFVAQAGDPNTKENQGDFEGIGTGGPGYGFEIELPPEGTNYDPYTVAMANADEPNTNGSQFFICLVDLDPYFPERSYTIFGQVTEGTDVIDAIGAVEVNDPLIGVPVDPVVIQRMVVIEPESTGS